MEIINKIEDSTPWQEVNSRILEFRNAGDLSSAIKLCQEACDKFPENDFYPKIAGDLYLQQKNYDSAKKMYLESLKKMPPNQRSFAHFAKRYYKLKLFLPKEMLENFVRQVLVMIENKSLNPKVAQLARDLIKNDFPEKPRISDTGRKFSELLEQNASFGKLVNATKILEKINPEELGYLLDDYILNRDRTKETIEIDSFFVSICERLEKYDEAIKIAEEVFPLSRNSIITRTIFRICRKLENYDSAENLLKGHPELLKSDNFNILFELVYYFESRNDLDQVRFILERMESLHLKSNPIQKTVKNFYLRFGLLDDVQRVQNNISSLSAGHYRSSKFSNEIQESEVGVVSKIAELSSEIEHSKRIAAISDLTTGISHELGQPITNIRYTAQFYRRLAEKDLTKEVMLGVFDSILEETERMGKLIKRLSPLTSSKKEIETFDIVSQIRKRVKAEVIRLKRVKVAVTVTPDFSMDYFGDPVVCDQLISNLLLNSIDAIKERKGGQVGKIDIQVKKNEENIEIVFTDNGVGIPSKNRGKIFDPFFSTKAPGRGEGLGLFIVWNLLKMQGGKITLDPEYNTGSRFLVSLPKTSKQD